MMYAPNGDLIWTDELVARLRKLWTEEAHSAEYIGRRFGCSRSAIIGKVKRLGIQRNRASSPGQARLAPRLRAPFVKKVARNPVGNLPASMKVGSNGARVYPQLPVKPLPPERDGMEPLCTFATLTAHTCRWPLGEPSADMPCCGRPKLDGGPYCGSHALIASGGLPEKKRRAA